jgi:tRNA A37 threonylcarbamoyladenosine modification protein TsaB
LARGIAAVDQLPIAACGSLELIAETCAPAARICALLDASQGKVYAAGFTRDGGALSEQHGAVVVSVDDLTASSNVGAELGCDAAMRAFERRCRSMS